MINVLLQDGSILLVADVCNEKCNLKAEELKVKISFQYTFRFPDPSFYPSPHTAEWRLNWSFFYFCTKVIIGYLCLFGPLRVLFTFYSPFEFRSFCCLFIIMIDLGIGLKGLIFQWTFEFDNIEQDKTINLNINMSTTSHFASDIFCRCSFLQPNVLFFF